MFDDEVVLYVDRYTDNGRLAIIAQSTAGEPYGVLSVNVPEETCLCDYEFFAKNYSENEELFKLALDTKMFDVMGFCRGFPILSIKQEYRRRIPKEKTCLTKRN
jgi:hypothetical protein